MSLPTSMALREDFNPRPPRGERLHVVPCAGSFVVISIHALREESDNFTIYGYPEISISIHALREESDALGYQE